MAGDREKVKTKQAQRWATEERGEDRKNEVGDSSREMGGWELRCFRCLLGQASFALARGKLDATTEAGVRRTREYSPCSVSWDQPSCWAPRTAGLYHSWPVFSVAAGQALRCPTSSGVNRGFMALIGYMGHVSPVIEFPSARQSVAGYPPELGTIFLHLR